MDPRRLTPEELAYLNAEMDRRVGRFFLSLLFILPIVTVAAALIGAAIGFK